MSTSNRVLILPIRASSKVLEEAVVEEDVDGNAPGIVEVLGALETAGVTPPRRVPVPPNACSFFGGAV